MPHKLKIEKNLAEQLDLIKRTKFKKEEWQKTNFKEIYNKLNEFREDKTLQQASWRDLTFEGKPTVIKLKNREKIFNFRIANEGFLFGENKRRRNILKTRKGKTELYKCKLCSTGIDTIKHDCKITTEILKSIGEKLNVQLTSPELILYHRGKVVADTTILILSIFKKVILKTKWHLDIENKNLDDNIEEIKLLTEKILKKTQTRIRKAPAWASTEELATLEKKLALN